MNYKEFFKECHEKEVFKNLSIYIVSSWVLVEVLSVVWEPFGLPKITMTYLLLVLLIGFPIYIYLIWKYRLKPLESKLRKRKGLKNSSKKDLSEEDNQVRITKKIHLPGVHFYSPFQKMYFTSLFVISLIIIFSASLIVKANFINDKNTSIVTFLDKADNNRIAVLPFDNNTAEPDLDIIGKMAVDWIMHGITQNKLGQVISPRIIDDYTKVLKASLVPSNENGVLTEYLNPSKVVTGAYYRNNDKLLLQCSVLNGAMNKTLISFELVECDPNSPINCIEAVKQQILGYLLSKDKTILLNEETPPNFRAYKLWLESDALSELQSPEQINYLNDAITADSSFFKPKIDRVSYYYNRDQFALADTLLKVLKSERVTKKEQLNIINHYEACFKGDNKTAYKTYKEEYNVVPIDLEINLSTMVLALQFVNRPQDVDSIYTALDMTDFDLDNCISCEYRHFIKGMANLELGRANETIELFEEYSRTAGHEWIKEVLMKAYVLNGETAEVTNLMEQIRLLGRVEFWQTIMFKTALEYLKVEKVATAEKYFNQLLNYFNKKGKDLTPSEKELQAKATFYKKDYREAGSLFKKLFTENIDEISNSSYLAMTYYQNGQQDKAFELLAYLNTLRSKYQFGKVDYALAQYYAMVGDDEKAMANLLKAVSSGKRFTSSTFQNDLLFKPYHELESFQKILKFWYD